MQSHALDRRYDATVAAGRFGGIGPTAYDESDRIDGLITEATLTSPSGGRLNWLIGAFATEYSHDRTGGISQQTKCTSQIGDGDTSSRQRQEIHQQ